MALSPFRIDEFDCNAEQLFDGSNSAHVERPAPTRIIRQIARCHAAKWRQPLAQTCVIGVDVLYVDGACRTSTHPFTGAQVDSLLGNPVLAGERPVSRVGIADQQRVRIKLRQKVLRQLGYRQCAAASEGIDRLAAAVARHQGVGPDKKGMDRFVSTKPSFAFYRLAVTRAQFFAESRVWLRPPA